MTVADNIEVFGKDYLSNTLLTSVKFKGTIITRGSIYSFNYKRKVPWKYLNNLMPV